MFRTMLVNNYKTTIKTTIETTHKIVEVVAFFGITHALLGITMYVIVYGINNPFNMLLVIFGSILPDIDIKYSALGKFNPFAKMMKHRGFTHTPMGVVLFTLAIFMIVNTTGQALAFGFGYLMHLIADTLTPMGIMWNYPKNKKYYSLSKKMKVNLRGLEGIIFCACLIYLFTAKII